MLVRIELERVATSTGDQVDKINARIGELAAQIADTELDVSTAIQLERLEEIERALAELDPAQFLRKTELPKPPGSAMAGPAMAPPSMVSANGAPHNGAHPNGAPPLNGTPNGAPPASSPESNYSSW
jgi:hypothetical protein